jgi:hypothetical protein
VDIILSVYFWGDFNARKLIPGRSFTGRSMRINYFIGQGESGDTIKPLGNQRNDLNFIRVYTIPIWFANARRDWMIFGSCIGLERDHI